MDKSYKYFIGIVHAGNISKASKKLRVSQPALSASLKTLENHLSSELLVRSKKGVSLTPAGEVVYEHALKLQDIDKNIKMKMRENKSGQQELNIGAIDSIAHQIVSQINVKNSYSQIIVDNSTRLIEKVKSGELDAAYITKPENDTSGLSYKLVAKEEMVAIAVKKYNQPTPLLAYNANSNTHRLILKYLKSASMKYQVILHSTDPHILLEAARLGKGVAIIPKSLCSNPGDKKLTTAYKSLELFRPIIEISRKGRHSPEILDSFRKQIANEL